MKEEDQNNELSEAERDEREAKLEKKIKQRVRFLLIMLAIASGLVITYLSTKESPAPASPAPTSQSLPTGG